MFELQSALAGMFVSGAYLEQTFELQSALAGMFVSGAVEWRARVEKVVGEAGV